MLAPTWRAETVVPGLVIAMANAPRLELISRAVFSRKPASRPSSQSATMTLRVRVASFCRASKISGQYSTSSSSSRRAWLICREVSWSEENKRETGNIIVRLRLRLVFNKITDCRDGKGVWPRNQGLCYLSYWTGAASNWCGRVFSTSDFWLLLVLVYVRNPIRRMVCRGFR